MGDALRSWPAPRGIRAEAEGVRASFQALRMKSVVEKDAAGVVFEAWTTPRVTGSIAAAVCATIVYLALDRLGATPFQLFVAVVAVGFYVPLWIVPSYRVSGRIDGLSVTLRIDTHGLLARRRRLEEALRFFLGPQP